MLERQFIMCSSKYMQMPPEKNVFCSCGGRKFSEASLMLEENKSNFWLDSYLGDFYFITQETCDSDCFHNVHHATSVSRTSRDCCIFRVSVLNFIMLYIHFFRHCCGVQQQAIKELKTKKKTWSFIERNCNYMSYSKISQEVSMECNWVWLVCPSWTMCLTDM